jgi:hypothetical protein
LEVVHKTLKTQESVLKEFEKKYGNILKPQTQKATVSDKKEVEKKSGGVLA